MGIFLKHDCLWLTPNKREDTPNIGKYFTVNAAIVTVHALYAAMYTGEKLNIKQKGTEAFAAGKIVIKGDSINDGIYHSPWYDRLQPIKQE